MKILNKAEMLSLWSATSMQLSLVNAYNLLVNSIVLTVEETADYADHPEVIKNPNKYNRFCFVLRSVRTGQMEIAPIDILEVTDAIALIMRS